MRSIPSCSSCGKQRPPELSYSGKTTAPPFGKTAGRYCFIRCLFPRIGGTRVTLDQGGGQDTVGVAGQLVLDLVQQAVHRHRGQHFLLLFDGGQVDAGQAAVPDIIEAQQGDILRDANAVLFGGLHDTQGIGVE